MRKTVIKLVLSVEQRDLIDRAARAAGKSRPDFMLDAACGKAQAIILDRTFFALDDAALARFHALLDAPVEPDPALDRLLGRRPSWEK